MKFQKGNKIWQQAENPGRPSIYKTPQELWKAACSYFEWCEENPLYEEKSFAYQGAISTHDQYKMRAFTSVGLSIFLNVSDTYFSALKSKYQKLLEENPKDKTTMEFLGILKKIKDVIYTQKFEGAAAGLLDGRIIARDLGLVEKRDVTSKGEQIIPSIVVSDSSLKEKLNSE